MTKSKWLRLVALLGVLALLGTACGDDEKDKSGGGDGKEACEWTIGTMGALSGDAASLGQPIAQGVEFAVDQANEAGDIPCTLKLQKEDSQGSPDAAPALAEKLIGTENLIFCACPYFSGETLATGTTFGDAGVAISGTGTNETIDEQGFTTWFRAVAPDNIQAQVAADYIKNSLKPTTVAVIHDNQDYSKGLAEAVKKNLGSLAKGPFIIDPEASDFSSVVTQVKDVNPDVVFYGGYTPQAGPLLKQLGEAGVDAQFLSDDGSKDPTFGDLAGEFAEGAQVTCPCTDPLKQESATDFVDGMRGEFGKNAPGTFAADVYDVTTMVIEGLKDYDGDTSDIDAVREFVVNIFKEADGYQGVAKTYSWEDTGEFKGGPEDIWLYKWSNKAKNFVSIGPAADLI